MRLIAIGSEIVSQAQGVEFVSNLGDSAKIQTPELPQHSTRQLKDVEHPPKKGAGFDASKQR